MAETDVYVLKITQSWRGKDSTGKVLPLHWAITVKTDGTEGDPTGNIYNAAGNIDTFSYEVIHDVPLTNANWRGDLPVATINKEDLPKVEEIFADVPTVRHDYKWNCQNWVWAALRELRSNGFTIRTLTWDSLRANMDDLLEAWENGDI
ncbi:uncharacterized protein C8Q71DRAFT_89583 [Rhodofomes roseus]|uniref:Uncharacterized protein n=1 Tax=Rhodofomes roseus TaxID=34475 RepID=A0A4Y9Z3A6_9APHY|nr:uncharacterized protein C8Q71DRAFT_89583 [Rhodofomes roseus]KAH9835646.1 hypothetical protein C8Q71DRAFT_89583 [Rhodofomes roseus]TFY68353.1 hypothetical protein EVJ58_g1045 [Rhodofomes roseus]